MSVNTAEKLQTTAAQWMVAPRKVLTTRLGAEEHGIDILRVQEIWSSGHRQIKPNHHSTFKEKLN